jgi:hypothetical protein
MLSTRMLLVTSVDMCRNHVTSHIGRQPGLNDLEGFGALPLFKT